MLSATHEGTLNPSKIPQYVVDEQVRVSGLSADDYASKRLLEAQANRLARLRMQNTTCMCVIKHPNGTILRERPVECSDVTEATFREKKLANAHLIRDVMASLYGKMQRS